MKTMAQDKRQVDANDEPMPNVVVELMTNRGLLAHLSLIHI